MLACCCSSSLSLLCLFRLRLSLLAECLHCICSLLLLCDMETPSRYWSGLYWDGINPDDIGEKQSTQVALRC